MTGGSHEIWVKLALLQMAEILRSSIKDHRATVSLSASSSLEIQKSLERKLNTDIASQRIKFEKSDILKNNDFEFTFTAEIQTN